MNLVLRFTCEECVEGMSWVEAYMKDPLWVAEYTLYLEQNYCVGEKPNCIDLVYTHFPPMHTMAMEQFWIPEVRMRIFLALIGAQLVTLSADLCVCLSVIFVNSHIIHSFFAQSSSCL